MPSASGQCTLDRCDQFVCIERFDENIDHAGILLQDHVLVHWGGCHDQDGEIQAGDAEQSIAAIRHLKPDAVILDIHMPEGGGMRVLKDSKRTDTQRVVLIFTAFPYPQYRRVYLAAGADYFFDKTHDVQKMTDVLVELAQHHMMNDKAENLDQEGSKAQ